MISKFWDEIFKLGDKYKKEHGRDSVEYTVLGEIKKTLMKVYDKGNADAMKLEKALYTNDEPGRDLLEAVDGIAFFKDRNDNDNFYEIDGAFHFDSTTEVLQYIVDERNRRYTNLYSCAVNEFTQALKEERDAEIERETKRITEEYGARIKRVQKAMALRGEKWFRKEEE